jgi:hypothetical protein
MDGRRARNHDRDRALVLGAIPSGSSWTPAVSTEQIIRRVRLPRRRILQLLNELDTDGVASVAGGLWRQSRTPKPRSPPAGWFRPGRWTGRKR